MNLVDLIKDQVSSEVTNKLSSLIGISEAQAKSAVGAAIPALLSALSGVTSSSAGAEKLASTINRLDAGALGKFADMLGGEPGQALQQGDNILGSLFGDSTLSALVGTLSRFVHLDAGSLKKLLSYLSPLVLGMIAKQLRGQPASAQGLKGLFAEQKDNIARALPSGLSLADIPGLPDIHSAASNMAATAQRATGAARDTGSSLLKTLLPLAALALLAFLGWQYFRVPAAGPEMTEVAGPITEHTVQKPVIETPASVPDVTQVTQNLTSVFATATDTLRDITDAATAEAALPKLNDLSTQIDGLATLKARLPAAARSTIANLTTDNMGKLTELIEKVLGIPGVKEKLEPVLNGLISKLNALQNNE